MLHQTRRDWLDYNVSSLLELHKRRDCEEHSPRLSVFHGTLGLGIPAGDGTGSITFIAT